MTKKGLKSEAMESKVYVVKRDATGIAEDAVPNGNSTIDVAGAANDTVVDVPMRVFRVGTGSTWKEKNGGGEGGDAAAAAAAAGAAPAVTTPAAALVAPIADTSAISVIAVPGLGGVVEATGLGGRDNVYSWRQRGLAQSASITGPRLWEGRSAASLKN